MRRSLPAWLLLAGLGTLAGAALPAADKPGVGPQVEQTPFGMMPDGKTAITSYTLSNRNGVKAKIIDYGGILAELHVPGL